MGLFDRVEQRLERAVNGAFARAFKSEVQPVEIASAIRRAMDDRAAVLGQGRTIVPNLFTVELSDTDYDRPRRLRRGARERADRRRPGARRVPALPARRPAAGQLRQRQRPRDRCLPAAHLHRPPPRCRPQAGRGEGYAAAPAPSPAAPPAAAPAPRRRGIPTTTGWRRPSGRPRRTPRPATPGQPGRPAVAGRRRRALPADGRHDRARPRRQRRHHPRRPRESPGGTARSA